MGLFVEEHSTTDTTIEIVVPSGRNWLVHGINVFLPSGATYCGVAYEVLGWAVFYGEFAPDPPRTGTQVIVTKGNPNPPPGSAGCLPDMAIPSGGKIHIDAPEAPGGAEFRAILVIED